jgi:hypothetical protein
MFEKYSLSWQEILSHFLLKDSNMLVIKPFTPKLKMKHILTSLLLLSFCSSISAQNTWYIPDDFSTIQSGINGSSNGDTVIVRDGTYFENINFSGKAITLKSEYGPATTIIDGMSNGTTGVSFSSGEGSDSILEGFTVTNCSTGVGAVGGGIGVHAGSSPVIRGNWIVDNTRAVPSGRTASGAGIDISGDGTLFENNIVRGNTTIGTHTWGGGVGVFGSGSLGVIVRNNLIYENTAASWPGGGGICVNDSSQNSLIENNTIFNNNASNGGGITVDYRSSGTTIRNNIVWGNTGGVAIEDGGVSSVTYNCVESGFTGTGNISTDPLFLDAVNDDFQLQAGSPCIDTADPNSTLDPDGTRADIGAFFFPQGGPDLFDDFEDGILDPSKWIANGPGTVTEENGQAVSRSRGHLTTVNEFSAELDGLRISGEINYQGRSSLEPTFNIAWRSEIGANGTAAEALAGAILYFGEPAPTQGFIRYVGISPYGGQAIDEAPFEMQAGESVRFLIKDFGGIITAEIENIDTGQTVSLSGTLPYTTSYGDHVKFYTREAPYNTTAGLEEIEIGPYHNNTDPMLAVNNLVSGQTAIVRVSDCTPRRPVMVMYSFAGGGPTNTPWGILSLTPPYYFFPPRIASSAGVAQFGKWVPNRFAGMDVWMQAIDWNSRAISNGLALTVQ